MAPIEVVDLTLDSDEDESPSKAAKAILNSFQAPQRTQRSSSVHDNFINSQLQASLRESNSAQTAQRSANVLSSHKKRRLAPASNAHHAAKGQSPPHSHGLPAVAGFPSYDALPNRQSQSHNGGVQIQTAEPTRAPASRQVVAGPSARRSLGGRPGTAASPTTSQLGNANHGHQGRNANAISTKSHLHMSTDIQANRRLKSPIAGEQLEKPRKARQALDAHTVDDEAARVQRVQEFNRYHANSSAGRKSSDLHPNPGHTSTRPAFDSLPDRVSSNANTHTALAKAGQSLLNDAEGLIEARKPSLNAVSARRTVEGDEPASVRRLVENSEGGHTEVGTGRIGEQHSLPARTEQRQNATLSLKRSPPTPPVSDDQRSRAKRQHGEDDRAEPSRHTVIQSAAQALADQRGRAAPAAVVPEPNSAKRNANIARTDQEVAPIDSNHLVAKDVHDDSATIGKAAAGGVGRARYTEGQNALLARLKTIEKLSWTDIMTYFPERSLGSLQVHYSTTVKGRYTEAAKQAIVPPVPRLERRSARQSAPKARIRVAEPEVEPLPKRRRRDAGPSAMDGFVSWTQVNIKAIESPEVETSADDTERDPAINDPLRAQDRTFPSSLDRILRQRELGKVGSRGWSSGYKGTTDETINHVLASYKPRLHFEATSGDVTCLAWRNDGTGFAAGSIAITDDRSMQYNSSRNLLVGVTARGELQELVEHHVARPVITDNGNPNALHSMRESQDPRLFTTVANVAYSSDGTKMYTAGSDRMARMYATDKDLTKYSCRYAIEHPAAVDVMDLQGDLLATACHTSEDGSISVFKCAEQSYSKVMSFSPTRADSQSSLPTFPSALRWGAAHHHRGLLLAGFASDGNDEDRDAVGETALWNVETGRRFDLGTITHNVFDVAWNPSSSSATDAFCVAGTPGHGRSVPGRKSVIQCYAANLYRGRAKQVLEWDCPAYDINDVLYCPHDGNLIAAGATDGKVYVWDKRFASRKQSPLHILSHGESLNVLDHDRDRELVDTGVRFLSWGATSSRLYSGSSDGVVKVWNPYRAPESAFVEDAATFQTAIMSGVFSPDSCDLLIGEERGRINLLSIGDDLIDDQTARPSQSFALHISAPIHTEESPFAAARALLNSEQIRLRNWGAMPKRQAVQGSAYSGPYLRPSPEDLERAQNAYDQAVQRHSVVSADPEADDHGMEKALQAAESCQAVLTALHTRELDYTELEPAARAKQCALRRAENRRITQEDEADYCKLDCGYFAPSAVDGVVDTQSSVQRIAGAYSALPQGQLDVALLDCAALFDYGLAGPCMYCRAISADQPGRAIFLRQRCQQRCRDIKTRFCGMCKSCSAPVSTQNDPQEGSEQTCVRCSFACFRCAKPMQTLLDSAGTSSLFCHACDMGWEVDMLGYDLLRDSRKQDEDGSFERQRARWDVDAELHYSELHHYHSRWGGT